MAGLGGVSHPLPSGDSWLAGRSDVSGGDSATELIENTTPPLVIISSRVKSPGKWEGLGQGVIMNGMALKYYVHLVRLLIVGGAEFCR